MQFFKDASLSSVIAGFVAVLVGFTSSIALVFQAAQSFGASPAQIASWVWALGIGVGLCCLLPSWYLRQPVMIAWSTPGAAVLAAAGMAGSFSLSEAVGSFMVCAVLVMMCGATGWFERLMHRIPTALASALLAGVLARFGLQAFGAAQTAPMLVVAMFLTYVLTKRCWPRYAVVLTLLTGVSMAALQGRISWAEVQWALAVPEWVTPSLSWQAIVSLALPLFVVTMASQNLPGAAVIRTSGYPMPLSRLLTLTGLATLVMAPFGAFALSLSAITAAICMGPEADANPARRYTAAMVCGALYLVVGVFGAVVAGLLMAFPQELVLAIAGLALLGSIGSGLATALAEETHREAALITFLVTLSGVVMAGVGSAFWGVVAGVFALFVQKYGRWPRWR